MEFYYFGHPLDFDIELISYEINGKDFIKTELGANNRVQKINTDNGKVVDTRELGTDGFSVGLNRLRGTNLAVINDIKKNMYTIFDLEKGKVMKTYAVNIPINDVIIADKVKLFD